MPPSYNAATHFIDRHLSQGRGEKLAFIDDTRSCSYAELANRVNRAGNVLLSLGVQPEQRVLVCVLDCIDFPTVFWGALKAGIVPVPVNTMMTPQEYDFLLRDSRARVLVVSQPLLAKFEPILSGQPWLKHVIIVGGAPEGAQDLNALLAGAPDTLAPAATTTDDVAFWLYSSGSTGSPKGVMHLQASLEHTARLYGVSVLGIRENDVVLSAAKLYFAYGLGMSMGFPLHVGATAALLAERATPAAIMRVMRERGPTLFAGVPTLYASILADPANNPSTGSPLLRLCVSAGEALPEEIGLRWRERFGVDILDGLGSTEMLHIFLSNRPGEIRYGTTGKAVPGYEVKLVDDENRPVGFGEVGDLWVKGPSAPMAYWNNRERSLATFHGPWTRTGDKFVRDELGYYRYSGRSDDMLKVSGQWVSPFEVESALMAHPKVLEAAVVAHQTEDKLVKPKAFVVLKGGVQGSPALAEELQEFVKDRLLPYKYPRWIQFVDSLPRTATGKIQRYKLR